MGGEDERVIFFFRIGFLEEEGHLRFGNFYLKAWDADEWL